jgi:cell surface protein SprA
LTKYALKNINKYIFILSFLVFYNTSNSLANYFSIRNNNFNNNYYIQQYDSFQQDSTNLKFKISDDSQFPYSDNKKQGLIDLEDPSNIKSSFEYDPITKKYIYSKKVGSLNYRPSSNMSLEEYRKYSFDKSIRNYWNDKIKGENFQAQSGFLPQLRLGGEAFNKIFGSNTIDIVPQGSAELIFGVNINEIQDPKLSEKLRKTVTFDFQEKIQMNVSGSIGDKIKLGVNYNTEATFDFENQTKLEYAGKEDEIIKKIEAGNITLPLPGSLITGSQSLFGLKTELQFGNLTVTNVFSQQKGETKVIEVKGGAQTQDFEVMADEYDANRHFFLSQYFRENYNEALQNLPIINSSVNITKIEVWLTNKTSNFNNSRNIIGLLDLGESSDENIYASSNIINQNIITGKYPDNERNELYNKILNLSGIRNINEINTSLQPWQAYNYQPGQDYEKIENARKLQENEYKLNQQLGYISLNTALNSDEVLAVAFEYTVGGENFKLGEFSTDGISAPEVLVVKLLKGTNLTPQLPNWKLMMKNVYSIGSYQINKENFILNVLYQDDKTGNSINYIPEGELNNDILLNVLNLDKLNSQQDAIPDGRFDFMDGITINSSNGRIFFPVVEPFGNFLKEQFSNSAIADKYVFEELYDSTLTVAKMISEKNKFKISGEYQSSSSSDIPLNALNIPKGSVIVTSGGRKLTENIDYSVDYNLGRVKIINQGLLESGAPLQISLESNSLYSMQTKTLLGTHLDYRFSEDFTLGATALNLTERPLTQKVSIGNEPISNTIWGLNGSYRTESQFLTSLVDKLPFLDTKEKSSILFEGEFANLIPGHSNAIKKEGNAYIDDFEGSETSLDMKNIGAWVLASTPKGQPELFPEGTRNNDLSYGYNRAKLAWYKIDPLFLRNTSTTPGHIKRDANQQSNHFVREIFEKEIFPNKDYENNIPSALQVLNLAFYPKDRGQYNYDSYGEIGISDGIDSEGNLNNPESRWGGIMREVTTSDFETANIEYIEFWLMDPFVYDTVVTNRGKLYFNLGNISEDILKDGRKSFENGLPTEGELNLVDTTAWGKIPLTQSLVNAFDNDPNSRKYQDIGLDGLLDSDEKTFFTSYLDSTKNILNPAIYTKFEEDPSNDNFHYFRGNDYDANKTSILERYKKYNGTDGNSPTASQSQESYPTTGSTLPDVEDINHDNTLNETESYYQYKVNLDPTSMEIGQNPYIVDKVTRTIKLENGEYSTIKWYQFKVPIRSPDKVVGSIRDFKSIRFMRMFLRGFQDSVILRFGKLDLVRSEWRKYSNSLMEGHEALSSPEYTSGSFEISSVNIEENNQKSPVNYILPPDIDRVIDPTNPQLRQLNEQAIVLKVKNLDDGDSRAAFKNINLDIRQYKKLKMYVHGEAIEGELLEDKDLRVFIRLGTDYKNNYYEFELPLYLTPPRSDYNNNSTDDRKTVWPEDNNINIDLSLFQEVKQARNDEMRRFGSTIDFSSIFSILSNGKQITIAGNPNLSNVRTVMIGIRNPSKQNNNNPSDDGMAKSGEIWFNELRLSDFKEDGGWAAKARLSARLADLGSVNISGSTSTPGFGSIEKKVNERSKEEIYQYDVSTNLNLGKFFPKESEVSIPMYLGYSKGIINPQYNPLDSDILLKDAINNAPNKDARDSIKNIAQDITERKSINFTNVKINKTEGKPHIYDPSNISVSYSYNEFFARNINTEYNIQKNYRGALNYNYNSRPKNIAPLRKARGILNSKALRIIKDFNFYYFPSTISFRTDLYRQYNATKYRNINNPSIRIEPSFNKDFIWNRFYDVKFDLSKSIKINFSAKNTARIDEPLGMVDKLKDRNSYEHWKDSVWTNILNGGRNTQYNHLFDITYRLPINKLPLLDWVSASARYNATYNWDAGPILEDKSRDIGNTIRNSNTSQLNGQLNLVKLYNKAGFLKRINQKYSRSRKARNKKKQYTEVTYKDEGINLKANRKKSIYHDLMTENITVQFYNSKGEKIKGDFEILSKKRIKIVSEEDIKDCAILVTGKIEKKDNPIIIIAENTARLLMSVKSISLSFSQTEGSAMPGYTPGTQIFGLEKNNNIMAPGLPYVLGIQDPDFAYNTIKNGWMTEDTTLNTPYLTTYKTNLNFRASIEPIKGLRIDLTANRTFSENNSSFYLPSKYGTSPYSNQTTGNFSISYITLGTSFEDITSDNNYASEAFNNFKEYRKTISYRLAQDRIPNNTYNYDPLAPADPENPNNGYYEGYGELSQDVLIPAFLAAYGIEDVNTISLSKFPIIPLPNWRITFNGLKELSFIKKYFKSINLSHSYRSSYNIGSFSNHIDYYEEDDGYNYVKNMQFNFVPKNEINSISINEQFSPLINIDMTWKNNLTTRFEIKKTRTLTLSFANNQLSEIKSEELSFSVGYRFDDFNLIVDFGNNQPENFKSDLNIRGNFSLRENKTILRKLSEGIDDITAGQKALVIGISADYMLSDRITLRFFFDRNVNEPFVSRSYPTSNTKIGFSFRFTLAQ